MAMLKLWQAEKLIELAKIGWETYRVSPNSMFEGDACCVIGAQVVALGKEEYYRRKWGEATFHSEDNEIVPGVAYTDDVSDEAAAEICRAVGIDPETSIDHTFGVMPIQSAMWQEFDATGDPDDYYQWLRDLARGSAE